jgi:WD40 repeat protein
VWTLSNGALVRNLTGDTGGIPAVAIAPDGARAVSGSSDNSLRVWNLATGANKETITSLARPWAVAMLSGGTQIAVGGDGGFVGVVGF